MLSTVVRRERETVIRPFDDRIVFLEPRETEDGVVADSGGVEGDKLFMVADLDLDGNIVSDFSATGGFSVREDELHRFGLDSKR